MSPQALTKTGQILKSIGLILAALGLFLTGLAPSIAPGEMHDLIYGLAVVCVALGGIIAHKNGA